MTLFFFVVPTQDFAVEMILKHHLLSCLQLLKYRGETNEQKFEYSFENSKGERTNSHIHVRTAKCTLYMYLTVRFLAPTSCAAEDAHFNSENTELATAPSVHTFGWGYMYSVSTAHAHVTQ